MSYKDDHELLKQFINESIIAEKIGTTTKVSDVPLARKFDAQAVYGGDVGAFGFPKALIKGLGQFGGAGLDIMFPGRENYGWLSVIPGTDAWEKAKEKTTRKKRSDRNKQDSVAADGRTSDAERGIVAGVVSGDIDDPGDLPDGADSSDAPEVNKWLDDFDWSDWED